VWGVLAGELVVGQRVVVRRPHRRVLVAGVRLACRELVRRRRVLPPRWRRLVRRRPHRRVLVAGVRLACRELVRRRCVLPPRGRRRRMPVRVARRARHHRPRVGRVPRRAGGHPVRRRRLPVHWRRRQPAPAVRLPLHLHFVGSTPSSKIQIRLQNLPTRMQFVTPGQRTERSRGMRARRACPLRRPHLGVLVALVLHTRLATPLREPIGAAPSVAAVDSAHACVPGAHVDATADATADGAQLRTGVLRLRGGGPKKAPKSGKQVQAKVKPGHPARACVCRMRANCARRGGVQSAKRRRRDA
jgi:hypothetical protein